MNYHLNSAVLAVGIFAFALTACNKTEVDEPSNPLSQVKDVKVGPFIFGAQFAGVFQIHNGANTERRIMVPTSITSMQPTAALCLTMAFATSLTQEATVLAP